MKHTRNSKTTILRLLRKIGWLCKKPTDPTNRIRISKTVNPDGSTTNHGKLLKQPLQEGNTFETELHIWKEIHKETVKFGKSK